MRTGVSFRVHGLDPRRVERVLGVAASTSGESLWVLKRQPQDGVELQQSLDGLLSDVEHLRAQLDGLRAEGAAFDFFCLLGSRSLEHAVELSSGVLRRIGALHADLWLDVYPDDET